MSSVSFEEQALLAAARETAGLEDFGPDAYLPGLRMLLRTYEENPFSEKGRRRNHRRLVGTLATRLRIEEAKKRHPEILRRRIRKPMLLTGLPRSGTSALFNLLGSDPAARPLLLWETQFPDPMEGLAPGASDPRRDAIEAHFARGREKNPDFTKIHYTSADTPEECVLLHQFALAGVQMGIEVMLEPYASWYREQDLGAMYDYYFELLQMLDWQRPGERWLLKAPAHMWGLDHVARIFPDVSIVWSHRDPLLCTASICSMTATLMAGMDRVDKEALGPIVMDFYASSLERGLLARDALDPARITDVHHDDFVDDPMGAARGIYTHFGIELSPEIEAALQAHVDSHPKGKHGSHDYGLEEFGLSPDVVLARFAPYLERFGMETRR